jgi:hypothetical protein
MKEDMVMDIKCKDCLYYLPVDVFKGICKKTKKNILPDQVEKSCFVKNKMCKFCKRFTVSDDDKQLGKCMDKALAYPDMNAGKCKDYIEK